jgi:hypothetical protein
MSLKEIIKTSGDLRRVLAQTIVDIKDGSLSIDRGLAIAAVSKEITSSLQAEINVAKVRVAMLQTGKNMGELTHIGKLLIEDNSPATIDGSRQ